jgi:putative spermidine/putrescine transport system ATP-binding protein
VFVRPEKIALVEAGGCSGTVRTRVFQGAQWLLEVETASGLLTVLRPNVGPPPPPEGAPVRLDWHVDDMQAIAP